jgi:acyl-CoA synthetase (AMP-forming)/AMP-acid ligase II
MHRKIAAAMPAPTPTRAALATTPTTRYPSAPASSSTSTQPPPMSSDFSAFAAPAAPAASLPLAAPQLCAGLPIPELVRRGVSACATQHAGAHILDGKAPGFASYADLVDDAARRAHVLVNTHGLAVGDRVLLAFPTSHGFISAFLAVQIAGAIPIPVPKPAGLAARAEALRLQNIVASSGARLLLTDEEWAADLLPTQAARGDLAIVVDGGAAPAGPRLATRPQRVAFVQYTSGSTTSPRGVVVDGDAAIAQFAALTHALAPTRSDVGVSWLPMFHDMGLVGCLLMPMVVGFDMVFLQPSTFLRRPARWLRALSDHRGTFAAGPTSAYALAAERVRDDELLGIDLRPLRIALHGAEPVRAAGVRAFEERFAQQGFRATSTTPAYGLAEATLAVALAPPGRGARFADAGCVIGPAVHGARVAVADDGEIVVDAPFVAAGYLDDDAASARVFGRAPDGTRRLLTGDVGAFVDGELVVVGRKKDLIITRGKKVAAEDVEAVVEGVRGVRAHGAIAFAVPSAASAGEGVVVVVALDAGGKDVDVDAAAVVGRVKDAVGDALGVAVVDVNVVKAGALPRTTSGKKQRSAARAQWLAQRGGQGGA